MASNFANQEKSEKDSNFGDSIHHEIWNTSIEGAGKVTFYKSFFASSNAEEASNVMNSHELDDNNLRNYSSSEEFEVIDNIELMLCSDKSSDDESVRSSPKEAESKEEVQNCREEVKTPSSSSSEFEVLDDTTSSPKEEESEKEVRNCREELKMQSSSSSEFEIFDDNNTSSPKEAESEKDVRNCIEEVKSPPLSSTEFKVDYDTYHRKQAEMDCDQKVHAKNKDTFSSEEIDVSDFPYGSITSSSDDEDNVRNIIKPCSKATCDYKRKYHRLYFGLKKPRKLSYLNHLMYSFALGVLFTILCTGFNYLVYTKMFGPIFPLTETTLPPTETTLPPIETTLPPKEPYVPIKTSSNDWKMLSRQFRPVLQKLNGDGYYGTNIERRMDTMHGTTFTMKEDRMRIFIDVNHMTFMIFEQENGEIHVQAVADGSQRDTGLLFTLPQEKKQRDTICPFIETVRATGKVVESICINIFLCIKFSIIAFFIFLKYIVEDHLKELFYLLFK